MMKLINIEPGEDGAVTLQFSREEFHTLRDTVDEAHRQLADRMDRYRHLFEELEGLSEQEIYERLAYEEEGLTEESLPELKATFQRDGKLLGQVYRFREALDQIVSEHDLARAL